MTTIALAGNPNVGKSTLFNTLTGLHQHTGNWAGKTVAVAKGSFEYAGQEYLLVDLPGTYSLSAHSPEETLARDFIESAQADGVVVVCDATCLERSLILALQVLELTGRVVICVNLLDEAERMGIRLDLTALSRRLGVPVIGISAAHNLGLDALCRAIVSLPNQPDQPHPVSPAEHRVTLAEQYAVQTIRSRKAEHLRSRQQIDKLLTSKATGIPLMLLLLSVIIWITVAGANYPSTLLSQLFIQLGESLRALLVSAPEWLTSLLVDGILRVTGWVVSVMLPPMAIFFPLFTLLEDLGYLPRVAFVLDHAFQRAHTCGKQALTMCQSLGCAACGVTGCRIIDSPRERLIAILTAPFVPCNGKFPTLIALITIFLVGNRGGLCPSFFGAALLLAVLILGVLATLACSKVLSSTVLRGIPSSFTLELPPFRRPKIGQVLIRSVLDRTLFVLGRAVAVAAPAGAIIWIMANVNINDLSLLHYLTTALDPIGRLLGMDGVILSAFLLGWPANEIVLPIILMTYLSGGTLIETSDFAALGILLTEHGWTWITAVCTMLFSMFHWPCSTTCLTVWKETHSLKWTLFSVALPTIWGSILCFFIATIARLSA